MPLDNGYGVVAGTVASFTREDPEPSGRIHSARLRLKTIEDEWETLLDVSTQHVGMSYRLVTDVSPRWMPRLATFPDGLHRLGPTIESGALDYVRSPMLRPGWSITWPWRMFLRGLGDLAKDLSLRKLLVRNPHRWHESTGVNALDELEALLNKAARVFVFGEPAHEGRRMRNVHMNQGDPPGSYQREDGVWQDGAVICEDAEGRYHVWQVRFDSQSLHTNSAGRPV